PEPQPPKQPTPPQIAPLVNITAALVNDTFTEKKQDEVVNTSTTNTPSGSGAGSPSGAPSGQQGNQKGGAQSAVARPALGFAAFGLGPLPSGMPPLTETRFRNDEVVFQIGGKLTNDELFAHARRLGLQILYQEDIGLPGRQVVRFRLASGQTVRGVIGLLQSLGADFF